jgi:hypothetical protein
VKSIVAVPGLAVDPESSWTWAEKNPDPSQEHIHYNWLSDDSALHREFPQARIMLYQYNSQYKGDNKVDSPLDIIATDFVHFLRVSREVNYTLV